MASLTEGKKGKDSNGRTRVSTKRILFVGEDGKRRGVRLGRVSRRQAEAIKLRIEAILVSRQLGQLDLNTARWIGDVPDSLHSKLAAVGLVRPRVSTVLGNFLDEYLASRTDLKAGSQLVYGHTRRTLVEFFGYDKPL